MGPGSALAVLACPGRRNSFSISNLKQQIRGGIGAHADWPINVIASASEAIHSFFAW
jgi:hypothetical protein